MRILGIIPARGGSKGIPGKNIKALGGKPLLEYTIDSALSSKHLTTCILSSDSEAIIETGKKLGINVPFTRPPEFAADDTPSLEMVKHGLSFFAKNDEYFDAVCLLQPTTPFRRPGLIDEAIEKFRDGNFDSLISVREIPADYNPHWAFEERSGSLRIATGEKFPIPRRQELPKAYHRDGAVYITKSEILLKGSLLGEKIGFVDTTNDPYVNLDTPQDWTEAENILKR